MSMNFQGLPLLRYPVTIYAICYLIATIYRA